MTRQDQGQGQYQDRPVWAVKAPSPSRMWVEAEGWEVDPETGTITNPGKFEGERCWVPYYTEMAGMGEEEEVVAVNGVVHYVFLINGEEKKVCPELEGFTWVVVWMVEDGSWYGEKLTKKQWGEAMEEYIRKEEEEGENE